MTGIIRHWPERQSQQLRRGTGDCARKQIQRDMPLVPELRNMHIIVQEQELMSYTNHRNRLAGQLITYSSQQLIEIHHNISPALLNLRTDKTHRREKLRGDSDIEQNRLQRIRLLVRTSRHEIDSLEIRNRRMHIISKKSRQLARLTLPHEHSHHLMSMRHQQPLHRHGLRKMTAALSLYDKQNLHRTISEYFTIFQRPS